jgi:GTP-binding protein
VGIVVADFAFFFLSYTGRLLANKNSPGTGGNGCVAFHREKFKSFGPPSGGNGGRGGDVYILPTPHLTTLSSIPKRVVGESGAHGQGTWQNGRNGTALVIKVPLGTVVKELTGNDTRRTKDEWEAEEEGLEGLNPTERRLKMREKRWLHYPNHDEDNVRREDFREAEASLYRQEREARLARRQRALQPIYLDLNKLEDTAPSPDAPLGTGHHESLGHLVARGGLGGLGNPHFLSVTNRSPKFATRGQKGERVTLSLELKLLADVGLVGMPNAGKSTLLRALTGGRAKSEVASYAFTTLNPVVGVVRVAQDGTFEGGVNGTVVHDETWIEEQLKQEKMDNGEYAYTPTRNQTAISVDASDVSRLAFEGSSGTGHRFNIVESFRFTIADNPGLISGASENVGLGHSFLRSMERSLALAYIVDLSGSAPWDELRILREELEKYQPGMSNKARVVIANKADLLQADDPVTEEGAQEKLRRLEEFVQAEMIISSGQATRTLDVVPTSAKYSQNLQKVVGLFKVYVEEARGLGSP